MEPGLQPLATPAGPAQIGTRDGIGAGDHDQPFDFGRRPNSAWTYPFTPIQFARLLVLRGRVQDQQSAVGAPASRP